MNLEFVKTFGPPCTLRYMSMKCRTDKAVAAKVNKRPFVKISCEKNIELRNFEYPKYILLWSLILILTQLIERIVCLSIWKGCHLRWWERGRNLSVYSCFVYFYLLFGCILIYIFFLQIGQSASVEACINLHKWQTWYTCWNPTSWLTALNKWKKVFLVLPLMEKLIWVSVTA